MVSSSPGPDDDDDRVDAAAADTFTAEGAAPPSAADPVPAPAQALPPGDAEPPAVMRRFRRGRWTLMPSSR